IVAATRRVNERLRVEDSTATLPIMPREPLARLVSIQVGLPTTYGARDAVDALDRPWRTGFFKLPVAGPVRLGRTNLAGDGQANRRVHGGEDKAVLGYAASHYPLCRTA